MTNHEDHQVEPYSFGPMKKGGRKTRRKSRRKSRRKPSKAKAVKKTRKSTKKKRGKKKLNKFFALMLDAKKKGLKSFKYNGKTYVGKKHNRLGMIYKKK